MNCRSLFLFLAGALFISNAAAAEPGADIFATNAPVLRIELDIPRNGIRSLQSEPRKPVLATLREGNTVYSNVLVHIKGAAGSFRDINSNPALTVSFAKTNAEQRFHGLRKIHLNNSVQDRSFTTENIVGQMFRDAGICTPRATNARLKLNGRDLGFYVVKEGWTKELLGMYFKNTHGNLYDGGFLQDIDSRLQKDAGDDRKDQRDLDRLAMVCRIDDREKRWAELEKLIDVDHFANFMAIEDLTWDWDGYLMNHNNYRVYHDPATDKIHILPHGMDQMFWDDNGSIYHPEAGGRNPGLIARAVLDTPQGNRLYRERIKQMFTNVYNLQTISNRFEFLAQRNREAVKELGNGALRDYDGNVSAVRERIHRRWLGIKSQIESEPAPLNFENGPIAIKRWLAQIEVGNARLNRGELEGKQVLNISANGGRSTASWRSKVNLNDGRYRFTALARTSKLSGYADEKGEGAGIRISGTNQPRKNKVLGDSGWTKLTFDFDVPGGNEVILVCESRANRGDVWFDLDSLKLEKLR